MKTLKKKRTRPAEKSLPTSISLQERIWGWDEICSHDALKIPNTTSNTKASSIISTSTSSSASTSTLSSNAALSTSTFARSTSKCTSIFAMPTSISTASPSTSVSTFSSNSTASTPFNYDSGRNYLQLRGPKLSNNKNYSSARKTQRPQVTERIIDTLSDNEAACETAQLVEPLRIFCKQTNTIMNYLQLSGGRVKTQTCLGSDDSDSAVAQQNLNAKSSTCSTITIPLLTIEKRQIVRRIMINGKHSILFCLNDAMQSSSYNPHNQNTVKQREMSLTVDDARDCLQSVAIPIKGIVQHFRFKFRTQLNSFEGITGKKLSLTVESLQEAIWFYEAGQLASDTPPDLMSLIINTNYYSLKKLSCTVPLNANGVNHDPTMFYFFESPQGYYLELGRWIAKWYQSPPKQCKKSTIKTMVECFDNLLCNVEVDEGDCAISQHCARAKVVRSENSSAQELDLFTHNAIELCFTGKGKSLKEQSLSCETLFIEYPPNGNLPRLGIALLERENVQSPSKTVFDELDSEDLTLMEFDVLSDLASLT